MRVNQICQHLLFGTADDRFPPFKLCSRESVEGVSALPPQPLERIICFQSEVFPFSHICSACHLHPELRVGEGNINVMQALVPAHASTPFSRMYAHSLLNSTVVWSLVVRGRIALALMSSGTTFFVKTFCLFFSILMFIVVVGRPTLTIQFISVLLFSIYDCEVCSPKVWQTFSFVATSMRIFFLAPQILLPVCPPLALQRS